MRGLFKKNLKDIDLENKYLEMIEENKSQFYKIAKPETIENEISTEEHFLDLETKMDLEEALNNLEIHERTIVVLKYFEGKKFDEISEILEKPISTVKTLLYRSLKKLKVNLEEVEDYE